MSHLTILSGDDCQDLDIADDREGSGQTPVIAPTTTSAHSPTTSTHLPTTSVPPQEASGEGSDEASGDPPD